MLGNSMVDFIGAFIQGFWDVIGCRIIRVAVPIVSFGKARVESETDENIMAGQRWNEKRWNEIRRDHNGKIIVNAGVAAFLFWVLVPVLLMVVAVIVQ